MKNQINILNRTGLLGLMPVALVAAVLTLAAGSNRAGGQQRQRVTAQFARVWHNLRRMECRLVAMGALRPG